MTKTIRDWRLGFGLAAAAIAVALWAATSAAAEPTAPPTATHTLTAVSGEHAGAVMVVEISPSGETAEGDTITFTPKRLTLPEGKTATRFAVSFFVQSGRGIASKRTAESVKSLAAAGREISDLPPVTWVSGSGGLFSVTPSLLINSRGNAFERFSLSVRDATATGKQIFINPDQISAQVHSYSKGTITYHMAGGQRYQRDMTAHERLAGNAVRHIAHGEHHAYGYFAID